MFSDLASSLGVGDKGRPMAAAIVVLALFPETMGVPSHSGAPDALAWCTAVVRLGQQRSHLRRVSESHSGLDLYPSS